MRPVYCVYFQKELEGLETPPFNNALGEEVFASVSKEAWKLWLDMQMKIINEYRLDLSESKDKQQLLDQMRSFLKLAHTASAKVLHVGTPTH